MNMVQSKVVQGAFSLKGIMKSHKEVQRTRESYHREPTQKAVHRSSLLVPEIAGSIVSISFLNHFLIKRDYDHVACKISGVSSAGSLTNAKTVAISEPRVYTICLSELLGERANTYLIEFYCANNLYVPFPAVMINHRGEGFLNSVHSYNRVFNDVFENDAINANLVSEASIDVESEEGFEPFFVFSSGILPVNDKITVHLDGPLGSNRDEYAITIPKLTHCSVGIGDICRNSNIGLAKVLRISQPPQFMFYGRLLVGTREVSTGAFSANHSYYDSSTVCEYWDNANASFRTYPLIPGFGTAVRMYPIMSPGTLRVSIDLCNASSNEAFNIFEDDITSPGTGYLEIHMPKAYEKSIKAEAMRMTARSITGNTPTRVSHQIVYYDQNSGSKLQASINVSLASLNAFQPPEKKAQSWGQVLVSKSYRSGLGFCFNSPTGDHAEVIVQFYCQNGCFNEQAFMLSPSGSWCLSGDSILGLLAEYGMKIGNKDEYIWYFARSSRADLTGYSVHSNLETGHTSGEHSF
jgi:hypothetical protein